MLHQQQRHGSLVRWIVVAGVGLGMIGIALVVLVVQAPRWWPERVLRWAPTIDMALRAETLIARRASSVDIFERAQRLGDLPATRLAAAARGADAASCRAVRALAWRAAFDAANGIDSGAGAAFWPLLHSGHPAVRRWAAELAPPAPALWQAADDAHPAVVAAVLRRLPEAHAAEDLRPFMDVRSPPPQRDPALAGRLVRMATDPPDVHADELRRAPPAPGLLDETVLGGLPADERAPQMLRAEVRALAWAALVRMHPNHATALVLGGDVPRSDTAIREAMAAALGRAADADELIRTCDVFLATEGARLEEDLMPVVRGLRDPERARWAVELLERWTAAGDAADGWVPLAHHGLAARTAWLRLSLGDGPAAERARAAATAASRQDLLPVHLAEALTGLVAVLPTTDVERLLAAHVASAGPAAVARFPLLAIHARWFEQYDDPTKRLRAVLIWSALGDAGRAPLHALREREADAGLRGRIDAALAR